MSKRGHTHLGSAHFTVLARQPEASARFWGAMFEGKAEDASGNGIWTTWANVGRSGFTFDFVPADASGPLHVNLLVEDMPAATQRALEAGGSVDESIGDLSHAITVADPEGRQATLLQVDDIEHWWTHDEVGAPEIPPAGSSSL